MLSTVLTIGGLVAVISGVAYLAFQYFPYFIESWDTCVDIYNGLTLLLPDWALPFAAASLLFATMGLIVKLL